MKKCNDCKYCILQDEGYSNYTVEGTTADCLLHKNPGFPEDNFYGKEPVLKYAEECDRFTHGDCVEVDVDQDYGPLENYSEDEEIKELLRVYS